MWALSLKNTWDSHVYGDSLEGLRIGCGITGHHSSWLLTLTHLLPALMRRHLPVLIGRHLPPTLMGALVFHPSLVLLLTV